MAKFYTIDPNTCSKEELEAAIKDCSDKVDYYACLEQGCKRFINSVYGALASKYYQCTNVDIAESITLQGQDLIKFSVRCMNDFFKKNWNLQEAGHKLIANDMKKLYPDFDEREFLEKCKLPVRFGDTCQVYGDTDSAYLTLQPLIDVLGIPMERSVDFILAFNKHLMSPYLDYCFERYATAFNCPKNLENFELEKIARSLLMIKKKKYVMDISWKEPDVHVKPLHSITFKGVEIIKGTSSLFCRTEQKNFVIWLMDKINKGENIRYSEIVSKIKDIKSRFELQNPNDISETMSISDYEKYIYNDKGTTVIYNDNVVVPFHAKAAAKYNNMLYTKYQKYRSKYPMIHKGDKVKIYYIKNGTEGDDRFAFIPNNFPIEFAPPIDMDEQFKKLILDPLNRYIEAMGETPVSNNFTYTNALY